MQVRFIVTLLAALSISTGALSEPFAETKTGWTIELDKVKRNCTMTSVFGWPSPTSTALIFTVAPVLEGGYGVAIMNGGWTSLVDGNQYELEFVLNAARKPWLLTAKGYNRNGLLGVAVKVPNDFVDAFVSSSGMQVFQGNKKLEGFALTETKEAVQLLSKCAFELKFANVVADPFQE